MLLIYLTSFTRSSYNVTGQKVIVLPQRIHSEMYSDLCKVIMVPTQHIIDDY